MKEHPARRPSISSFPRREKAENKLPANPFGNPTKAAVPRSPIFGGWHLFGLEVVRMAKQLAKPLEFANVSHRVG